MNEIEILLKLYRKARAKNLKMALATVVSTTGSVYRRPGARMLITAAAEFAGTISGGCIERDLIERAQELCSMKAPKLMTYQSSKNDPYDFGSGCDGTFSCLVEPLDTSFDSEFCPVLLLEEVYRKRIVACSATVFSAPQSMQSKLGARVVHFQNNSYKIDAAIDDSSLLDEIVLALKVLTVQKPAFSRFIETSKGIYGVFLEKIEPPIKLLILGAGDDAIPLAAIAHAAGLAYSVADYREGLLDRKRFPKSERIIRSRPDKYSANLIIDEFTACVIMHHHYETDMAALEYVLSKTESCYVGVLCPKKRTIQMLSEKSRDKPEIYANSQRDRLFAPVGLDIGAETPEEIAIAIVAEITACCRRRAAVFLRQKEGSIHEVSSDKSICEEKDNLRDGGHTVKNSAAPSEQNAAVENVQLQCRI